MEFHFFAVDPNAPNGQVPLATLRVGNPEAVSKSVAGEQAMRAGRLDEAISLHRESLALKLRDHPEFSREAGISYNGLGECFLRAGRLDKADEWLQKALEVREAMGPAADVAATRDNVGALREAQGRFGEAREIRLRGAEKKQMLCGNYDCPTDELFGLDKLNVCSACSSVFYCSKSCQKQDWKNRHKPLCKAGGATSKTSN
ncbi:hypothetical protein F5Y06DRAFT_297941 [Hypoxylon sp. FL0890]|nr:hypothetical protein F5Y06DRAFT_297941 [Hypoxylon sp. FL0890]